MSSKIAWSWEAHGENNLPPLVLLHGFAGSRQTWNELVPMLAENFHCVVLDLPGHGTTPPPTNSLSLWELAKELHHLIADEFGGVFVCGYSMGGRVALHLALQNPETVRELALLGASPGIPDEAERVARRSADRELANNIRERGIKWFADYWSNLPLFASQKKLPLAKQETLRCAREACDAEGLAFALENFGTGEQDFLLPRLAELHRPLLLLAGKFDDKFCALNQKMERAAGSTRVQRVEIPSAGHAAHLENPSAVAHELIAFFTQQDKPS
jgi:2-succinyl-6-hydroxy-2,4-cyclohexadiene-1-carboxylate synthase